MIIHLLCIATFAAIWFFQARALKRRQEEFERKVAADCAATRGQVKVTLGRVDMLRKNAGKELDAVSERLYKVEERETMPCETN